MKYKDAGLHLMKWWSSSEVPNFGADYLITSKTGKIIVDLKEFAWDDPSGASIPEIYFFECLFSNVNVLYSVLLYVA